MRLCDIEVRDWRGLTQSLSGLSPALNLILGPNESGKSRLQQAIRFALFESHKGAAQHKTALQAWGGTQSPYVRIAFEHNGKAYEVRKQFLKGAYAQLEGDGQTLSGDDAETALRTLLGGGSTGSRRAAADDLGIWPLLMVEQGDSRQPIRDSLTDASKHQLQQRLSNEIGLAAISAGGQRLMERIDLEYARYFTGTGQDGVALKAARTEARNANAELTQAELAYSAQGQFAERLAEAKVEVADLLPRVARAEAVADEAKIQDRAAQQAATRLAHARGDLQAAGLKVQAAEAALQERKDVERADNELAGEIQALDSDQALLAQTQASRLSALDIARDALEQAQQAYGAAKQAVDAARNEQRRLDLERARADVLEKIAALRAIADQLETQRRTRAALPDVNEHTMFGLRAAEQGSRDARVRLQGAAVSVSVLLHQASAIDGTPHAAGERIHLDVVDNQSIAIGELATVEIRPGSGDLDALRRASIEAELGLTQALAEAGVTTVAEAERAFDARQACTRSINQLKAQAAATSPRTLADLEEDQLRFAATLEPFIAAPVVDASLDVLERGLSVADDALTQARAEHALAQEAVSEIKVLLIESRSTRDAKATERQRYIERYEGRDAIDALQAQRDRALQARREAQSEVASAEQAYGDLGGETAHQDAERVAKAAASLATRLQDAKLKARDLQGQLSTLVRAGSYEIVQQAQGRAEHAQRDLARLEQQARAAKRLHSLMHEQRRRVIEQLTTPVLQRVAPYLAELFPGSTLLSGDGLEFGGLQSGNQAEPFDDLSGGAQEQLALLTRIGLAEVLAGDGTLPLLLDDALINSDPDRIKRIHRALYRAAERLQFIVFSCHDVLFDDLGADQTFLLPPRRRAARSASVVDAEPREPEVE